MTVFLLFFCLFFFMKSNLNISYFSSPLTMNGHIFQLQYVKCMTFDKFLKKKEGNSNIFVLLLTALNHNVPAKIYVNNRS